MATVLHIDMIISDPEIRSGKPIIVGTSLRVSDVVAWHVFGGQTVEEIALGFNLPKIRTNERRARIIGQAGVGQ